MDSHEHQRSPIAADQLLPSLYDELRALAARRVDAEGKPLTLQATALVHEAYLRLLGDGDPGWNSRGHFYCAAAEAMRRILVERARRKGRLKHGNGWRRVPWEGVEPIDPYRSDADLLALDFALQRLEVRDPERGKLVKLRYFAGLTMDETAQALGISPATAYRMWTFARAFLCAELRGAEVEEPVP